jgi:hypothetical protein
VFLGHAHSERGGRVQRRLDQGHVDTGADHEETVRAGLHRLSACNQLGQFG